MARVVATERRAVESRVVLRRWREIVAAWKRSGQDERVFCRRQKIGVCALRWWVRRLAGDDAQVADGARRARSREQWVQLCADWQSSGLRQAEFCRRRGLNLGTLRWWRSQLRTHARRDVQVLAPPARAAPATTSPVPTFVPVTVTAGEVAVAPRRARGPTIDVVLRGHRRIRVGPDLDERLLARVVLVLEAIP